MSGNKITPIGIKTIGDKLENLSYLDIAETSLETPICRYLSKPTVLPHLKRLVVNPDREEEFREAISAVNEPETALQRCEFI